MTKVENMPVEMKKASEQRRLELETKKRNWEQDKKLNEQNQRDCIELRKVVQIQKEHLKILQQTIDMLLDVEIRLASTASGFARGKEESVSPTFTEPESESEFESKFARGIEKDLEEHKDGSGEGRVTEAITELLYLIRRR